MQRVLTAVVLGVVGWAAVWSAADAVPLDADQVTDAAGALDPADEARVTEALDRLRDEDGVQLWVVFVRSFEGANGVDFAEATAIENGLGVNDALLAVAIDERLFGYSVDSSFPLSDKRLEQIAVRDIEPALRDEAWAEAAIAAAEGYRDAIGASGGGAGWLVPVGIGAVGAGGYAAYRLSKRRTRRPVPSSAGAPVDPYAGMDEDDLVEQGSVLLVEVDDALKTSAVDLSMAEVEFGAEAVASYRTALSNAEAEVRAAYRVRMTVNDLPDRAARRDALIEVIERARRADAILDAHAGAFEELRDRANRAPEVLAGLARRHGELDARVPAVTAVLHELRAGLDPSAIGEVDDNDAEARERIEFARARITAGNDAVTAGNRNAAALDGRVAEEALHQAETLLNAVDQLRAATSAARAALGGRLESLRRDLADADSLGLAEANVAVASAAAAAARSVLAEVPASAAAIRDPVTLLARLAEAEARLDEALAPARDAREQAARAHAQFQDVFAQARARVGAVGDFITTRRGGVGVEARTKLAEAESALARAGGASASDPVGALAAAQQALASADAAARLAERDVENYRRDQSPPGGGVLADLGGAVLGGILIDSMRHGGGGAPSRDHGSGGLPPGGGGASPGHFGGSRRRGGGGRF